MRNIRRVLIIGVFLLLGYWIGFQTEPSNCEDPNPSRPPNNQTNILLIGTDNLKSSATLESVWLIGFFSNHSQVILTPLYPSPKNSALNLDEQIKENFELNILGHPESKFIESIQECVWIDGYILVEDIGLVATVEFLGGVDINDYHYNGFQALNALTSVTEDPQLALKTQSILIKAICQEAAQLASNVDFKKFFLDSAGHIKTNMDISTLLDSYQSLRNRPQELKCEIPLLQEES